MARIQKIISGGLTGADLAALDFAILHGIPHGGWCSRGRKAEDGTIDAGYQLKETPSSGYPVIHISRNGGGASSPVQELLRFIQDHRIKVLNVAGPRASKEPGVYDLVKNVLGKVLGV